MKNKKIFILLPDGVGLRNFAYTNFHAIGTEMNFDIVYWNNTPFPLKSLGFNEIKIQNNKSFPLSEYFKNARKHIELNTFIKNFKDPLYTNYRFPMASKTIKQKIKKSITQLIIKYYNSEKGLEKLKGRINNFEQNTAYFKQCIETLKKEQPSFVFCTNQRPLTAIAPIQAAKKLGIPTGTFIFSWDNLPKATLVIETDFYFVWSEHMKQELQKYYPTIATNQILVTGTPQFENHFNFNFKKSKETFFQENDLETSRKYICYSGDDITTSPNDPYYLKDTAIAVRNLNTKGFNLGIIFRRCPVDFSNRFDKVIEEYSDVISVISPLWENVGNGWDTVLPTKEDMVLQTNTVAHTEFVINLGSSMVFDYVAHNKSCAFINYNVSNSAFTNWNVEKIYKYIHFRSMPTKNAVVWLNTKEELESKIEMMLSDEAAEVVTNAKKWFEVITVQPSEDASLRIWKEINNIIKS